jgi:tetratricopeptide (TPR) repeat protein
MTRTGRAGRILAVGVLLALSANASSDAADNTSGCTQPAVEVDAAAVIAPCTALLETPDLSDATRSLALFIRGQGYHRTKQLELALRDYEAALKLTPNNDAIYPERANVALRLGHFEEWMALLKRALAINPKNARALRMIGAYLRDAGQLDQAIQYLSMALDADPAEAHALLFRSYIYQTQKRFDLALRDANALVAMPAAEINRKGYLGLDGVKHDFHIMALGNRADIYSAIGKYDLAEQDLDAAVDYKRSAASLEARAEFLMDRPGQQQRALDDLDAATTLDPDRLHALYLKGAVLVDLKRYDEALAALDRALTISPNYDFALRLRAIAYRALGKTNLAVQDLEHAVVTSPRVAAMTIRSLQIAGYWPYGETPRALTPGLQDAIRACMLDNDCH